MAEGFPELIGKVRREGGKRQDEDFEGLLVNQRADLPRLYSRFQFSQLVDELHGHGDVRVVVPAALHVHRDVAKRLVGFAQHAALVGRQGSLVASWAARHRPNSGSVLGHESIDTIQEACRTINSGLVPVQVFLGRSGEKDVDAYGVRPVLGEHFRRVDHIPLGL